MDFRDAEKVLSLDMLLIDENSDQMHSVIPNQLSRKYANRIKEGGIYFLQNFNISVNRGSHRPVQNDLKLYFNWSTLIEEFKGDTSQIPKYKFTFTEYEELPARFNENKYLTDVIGKLIEISHLQILQKTNGKEVQMREIVLQNIRGTKLNVTLWGEVATQIDDQIVEDTSSNTIIITTSTVVRMYKGAYNLWSTNATKLYTNLEISEVDHFKESCNQETCIGLINPSNASQKVVEDMLFENRRPISKLLESVWDESGQGNTYTCKASITRIIDDYGWYYMSCKTCRKKVMSNDDGKLWCHKCVVEVQYPIPRFMLRMEVEDCTGSTIFVAFDKEVEKLLLQPAVDMLNIYKSENGLEKVSAILNDVVGYERVFQLKLNEFNMKQGNQSFTVTKIFPVHIMLECQYAQDQFGKGEEENDEHTGLPTEAEHPSISPDKIGACNEASKYIHDESPKKRIYKKKRHH